MSLSWIKRPKPPTSVDELVAAGKYRKAIDLLRGQFSQRYPSTTERQGYAELLVRAGRGAEAVPVLLGIADEQERYGFPDKALEALRCAAAIDPEQAEVKERLESIGRTPSEAPAADKSAPVEGAVTADNPGTALDGALTFPAGAPEPAPAEEEIPGVVEAEVPADVVPDGESGLLVLDAEAPAPLEHGGEPVSRTDEAVSPAPPGDGQDLVVVEEADEDTVPSIRVEPTAPVSEEGGAAAPDDGEITARSIQVDPSVLGEEQPSDKGEITARSIQVDPSVLGEKSAAEDVDEGEITARSLQVDPSVPGGGDDEATAPSIRVEPSVLGAEEPGPEEGHTSLEGEEAGPIAWEAEPEPTDPSDGGEAGGQHLLLPEDDLDPEEVEELTAEDGPELDARTPAADLGVEAPAPVPGSGDVAHAHDAPPFHTGEDPPEADDGRPPLLTDEELEAALTAEAAALLADGPADDESGSLDDDAHVDHLLATDARALLSDEPQCDDTAAGSGDRRLDELLAIDAQALLSGGPTKDGPEAPGDPDQEAAAAPRDVAVEDPAREGQHPDETHLFLSEDDLLGALTAESEPSTKEDDNEEELDGLVRTLAEAGASGTALHFFPSETADPLQVATALRARYGSCDWSARVRLHLSGLMLEAGRAEDALDTLTGVAEDLAQQGHGRGAIAILKKAGRLRHRGANGATEGAALREGAEALLSEAAELAAGASPTVEEETEGPGQEQGNQLSG
jgi:hypothetical protein